MIYSIVGGAYDTKRRNMPGVVLTFSFYTFPLILNIQRMQFKNIAIINHAIFFKEKTRVIWSAL
jgi:hypothetical protein